MFSSDGAFSVLMTLFSSLQLVSSYGEDTLSHHSVLGDDEAADVVGRHPADRVVHGGALVDLVVDVEVARLLPRVLRRAHVCHARIGFFEGTQGKGDRFSKSGGCSYCGC